MHSSIRIAVVMLGLGGILPPIKPQEGPPTFKTGVTVVNVPVTVGRLGGLVTDLEKNDFEILDNGKRQEISYLARQADIPLNVALLVDVSGSVNQIMEDEKTT